MFWFKQNESKSEVKTQMNEANKNFLVDLQGSVARLIEAYKKSRARIDILEKQAELDKEVIKGLLANIDGTVPPDVGASTGGILA